MISRRLSIYCWATETPPQSPSVAIMTLYSCSIIAEYNEAKHETRKPIRGHSSNVPFLFARPNFKEAMILVLNFKTGTSQSFQTTTPKDNRSLPEVEIADQEDANSYGSFARSVSSVSSVSAGSSNDKPNSLPFSTAGTPTAIHSGSGASFK